MPTAHTSVPILQHYQVHANSATWIARLVAGGNVPGNPYGTMAFLWISDPWRYNLVDNSTPLYTVEQTGPSSAGYIHDYLNNGFPVTSHSAPGCQSTTTFVYDGQTFCINPTSGETSENNLVIVNPYSKTFYELYDARNKTSPPGTSWKAVQARVYNNTNYELKTVYTGAAYGNAILPLILTKRDLTQSKEIDHVLEMSVPASLNVKVWPARVPGPYSTGSIPYGAWLRLKPSFDINGYTSNEYLRKVLRAMKTHGMINTDNTGSSHGEIGIWAEAGGSYMLGQQGNPFPTSLEASDFEIIDPTNMIRNGDTSSLIKSTYQDYTDKPEDPFYPVDPYAGYVPPNLSGIAPVSVQFTDISYDNPNNVTYWVWSFKNVTGNNTWTEFSYAENPLYTFTDAGNYTVNLTAGNDYGYNITPATVWVNVSANNVTPPVANFWSGERSGTAPYTSYFHDDSTNTPTSWNWSFGDGNYSTAQDPMHVYVSPGVFTVVLTTCNAGGCDSDTEVGYVYVATAPIPVANFFAAIRTGVAPLNVSFNDLSTNTPTSWNWSFGDNSYSDAQNPTHVYAAAGTYTINFTACTAGGCDSDIEPGYVTVTTGTATPTATPTPTPTVTPTVTPTAVTTSSTGPQIHNWSSLTSSGITLTVNGITGTDVWAVYGQNSGKYAWITSNATATGGWATIPIIGGAILGDRLYYTKACDSTGCGNEASFTTVTVTQHQRTNYGAAYKNITGMR